MDNLINNISEVEKTYEKEKLSLLKLKIATIFLGIGILIYSYIRLLLAQKKRHLSDAEIDTVEGALILIVLIPIFLTPLYKFFSDKVYNKFNWGIKKSIFETIILKYNATFNLSLKGTLTEIDINNLDLENTLFTFCYGDDLIMGTVADVDFRISEIHSGTLFKSKFDGIAGVLLFNNESDAFISYQKIIKEKDTNTNLILKKNKLYLIKKGDKSHFEFKIKKGKINREKLIQDFKFFEDFSRIMFSYLHTK